MKNTLSDAELTACYREANGEMHGKAQPLTTQRIFRAMRAAIVKWGTHQPVPLGFTIENRAGIDVLVWEAGGCRPATSAEVAMWKALSAVQQPVVRELLTREQALEIVNKKTDVMMDIRLTEAAHGITGGQHGTE